MAIFNSFLYVHQRVPMIAIKLPASTTPRTWLWLRGIPDGPGTSWIRWFYPTWKTYKKWWKITMLSMAKSTINMAMFKFANCWITRSYPTIHDWSRVKQLFQGWFIGFRNHPHVRHSTRGWMESSIQFPQNPYKGFLFHIPQYGHTAYYRTYGFVNEDVWCMDCCKDCGLGVFWTEPIWNPC